MGIDWLGIASAMLDADLRPSAWLDPDGRVQLVSSTMVRLLAAPREALAGAAFPAALGVGPAAGLDELLARAAADGSAGAEVTTVARDGRTLRFRLAVRAHGAPVVGFLATVSDLEMTVRGRVVSYQPEVDYEVELQGTAFGRVVTYDHLGGRLDEHVLGRSGLRCHASIHDRPEPCPDCPLLRREGGWPRLAVRRLAALGQTEIVTASAPRGGRARLSVRRFSDFEYSAAIDARIAARARHADLSERERAVLRLLLHGTSLDDVAAALSVTPRTAKFHQENLLRKLGADSRADLPRVLL